MSIISEKKIQAFIQANLTEDLTSLLLKKSPFPGISMQEIVQQIKGRKVAEKKFPFFNQNHLLFPPGLNLEQASSQITAEYKSLQFKGEKFLDLTCGFGIDAFFLSQNFEKITLVEQNAELLEMVKHNWEVLGRKAHFVNQKLEEFLDQVPQKYDLIYLDPARRDQHNRKVFLLENLSPNIHEIQDKLTQFSDQILIKLSPLIDLQSLIFSLNNLTKIWIIAVKNEVKEVLILLKNFKKNTADVEISCINLGSIEPEFNFKLGDKNNSKSVFSSPEKYIYVPNNSVLKSGAFNWVSEKYNLKKLHPNSHVYTAAEVLSQFPGRIFLAKEVEAKSLQKGGSFNIITKNYPLKPEEIKKKYQLKDGGTDYLIFTQSLHGKHILKAQLI